VEGLEEGRRALGAALEVMQWRSRLRRAVLEQVDDRLLFDEPEVEIGQQDGKLREEWTRAYWDGLDTYAFNDVTYDVYRSDGTPLVPQVCIDFCLDTYERASGRWFRDRSSGPGRTEGFISFADFEGFARRLVPGVARYAEAHPEVFDYLAIGEDDRVPFRHRDDFNAALLRISQQLEEGDIVGIYGLREEDMEYHYHSFLVYAQDPLSGIPTGVALNAGRARVVPVHDAMRNAPRRSLRFRARIRWDWIRARMVEASLLPPEPVPVDPADIAVP
jgi:hypothetical protein